MKTSQVMRLYTAMALVACCLLAVSATPAYASKSVNSDHLQVESFLQLARRSAKDVESFLPPDVGAAVTMTTQATVKTTSKAGRRVLNMITYIPLALLLVLLSLMIIVCIICILRAHKEKEIKNLEAARMSMIDGRRKTTLMAQQKMEALVSLRRMSSKAANERLSLAQQRLSVIEDKIAQAESVLKTIESPQ